jgi:RNA-directed DNA polymerase
LKRINNLFSHITSCENLLIASRLAMKGSGKTSATCRFFYNLETEILSLQTELLNSMYRPGAYRYFKIFDPKERVIAVAPFRDRVVHHAVVRILTPIYERVFIYDSYATRPNKGTHAAIKRAQKFIQRWPWYFKADIEKYFDHVDHDILLDIIERKIKDRRLLRLLERIIRNTTTEGKGLPIGNLTSQFLANVYLDPLDHEIKDKLGVKGYLRYMDDFVLFGYSKRELLDLNRVIEQFLSDRLRLRLKINSTWLNRSSHGLSFLGMRIFPRFIRVKPENRKRSMQRMSDVINKWKDGRINEERMVQSMASIVGHFRYFCPNVNIALEVGAGKKAVRTG